MGNGRRERGEKKLGKERRRMFSKSEKTETSHKTPKRKK